MKRFVALIINLVLITSIYAQKWEKVYHPADELLRTIGYTTYMYTSDKVNLRFGTYDDSHVFLYVSRVDYELQTLMEGYFRIGFYDENGKLISKWKSYFHYIGVDSFKDYTNTLGLWCFEDKKIPTYNELPCVGREEIKDYLLNNSGYVRFVTETDNYELVDFIIPCYY